MSPVARPARSFALPERAQQPRVVVSRRIRHILALTDFSEAAERGLDRAARVAAQHHARLRLLFCSLNSPRLRIQNPLARLELRARQLARRHGVATEALGHAAGRLRDVLAAARGQDLLVAPAGRRGCDEGLDDLGLSRRLLRRVPCPTLFVRRPAHRPYGQLLGALDRSVEALALVRFAHDFDRDAELELFHRVGVTGAAARSREDGPGAIAQGGATLLDPVAQRRVRLSDSFDTRRNRVDATLGAGDLARQTAVQQQASDADLVLVGRRPRLLLLDWLRPCTAARVLQQVSCDVLVVPAHVLQDAERAPAPARLQPAPAR